MIGKTKYLVYTGIIFFAYSLFLMGFFPLKVVIPGHAKLENFTIKPEGRVFGYPQKKHDKLVIILIDALRADFVYERNSMQFLKGLVKRGKSQNFVLRAHPPTVTLPRIKAITTGSIPGFVDVVLNYDSQALNEDNIITQAWNTGRKIVFYGDDTWMKLFPDHFIRNDGTTSFFVTDFTEVDNNVTRHLDRELSMLDWDLMVLHYLGLDHIGHTMGPNSPLVDPKLQEMDKVVETVYKILNEKSLSSVILVCGDHGMSDQGSHGGASDREVFVPALLLSPSFTPVPGARNQQSSGLKWTSHREQLQIDLAPTLSVLMGLPVPRNNLGQVLIGALDRYTDQEKIDIMYINSQQTLKLLQTSTPDYTTEPSYELFLRAVDLHESFADNLRQQRPTISDVLHGYETAMDAMATKISSSLTNYDLYSMTVGIILLLMMLANEVRALQITKHKKLPMAISPLLFCVISLVIVFGHMTACTSQSYYSTRLCGTSYTALLTQSGVFLCLQFLIGTFVRSWNTSKSSKKRLSLPLLSCVFLAGTFGHSVSLLSSSYVEEEHQTWYFLVMTFNLVVIATIFHQSISKHVQKSRIKTEKHCSEQSSIREECEQERTNTQGYSSVQDSAHTFPVGNTSRITATQNGNIFNKAVVQTSIFDLPISEMIPWQQVFGIVGVMLLGRCLRSINQTGDKWLAVPDVGDWLVRPENKLVLSILVPVSMITIFCILASSLRLETMLVGLGLIGCHRYRVATKTVYSLMYLHETDTEISKGISEAMFVYCVIFAIISVSLLRYILFYYGFTPVSEDQKQIVKIKIVENTQGSFVVLMALLFRPHNTVLVAMVVLQEKLLWKHFLSVTSLPVSYITLQCWWMGQAVFFQQGNSNSFSTVDVAAGYVGLQDFTPAIVSSLIYSSTYAGPIFWLLTLTKYILTRNIIAKTGQYGDSTWLQTAVVDSLQMLTLERLVTLALYCIVVTTQRYHLFVWTVFSPKLVYEAFVTLTYTLFSCSLYFLVQ